MFEITNTARVVSSWTNLGVDLPADLAKSLGLIEAVRYVEVEAEPVVNLDNVTDKNIGDTVDALAQELAIHDHKLAARRKIETTVARTVVDAAGAAVPGIINQLTPGFDEAVERYTAAVKLLPEELTSDALVAAGPGALAALGQAQEAAAYLERINGWVASLNQIPAYAGHQADPALRLVSPDTYGDLVALLTAHSGQHNQLVISLNPVWLYAAREAVAFEINTPRDAAGVRSSIESAKLEADQRRHEGLRYARS